MTTYQKLVLKLLAAILFVCTTRAEEYLCSCGYSKIRRKHSNLIKEVEQEIIANKPQGI